MINFHKFLTARMLIFEAILLTLCVVGDKLMSYLPSHTNIHYVSAVVDNLTHGLIGFFSWAVIIDMKVNCGDVTQCITCLILASSVDVDHFLAARSFNLNDALSLSARPPFHATTIIPLVGSLLVFLSFIFPQQNFNTACLLFVTAWFSHHIRDATRRGLWLPPFGSSSPVPYIMYIVLNLLLPFLSRFILLSMNNSRKPLQNIDVV